MSDRFFFITCRVYRPRGKLNESEFAALAEVVRERRKVHRFLLTAWVFLPDPATVGGLLTVSQRRVHSLDICRRLSKVCDFESRFR